MSKPKKRKSEVSAERVRVFLRGRFNPIRGLTPALLARQLDDFDAGRLRELALTMNTIEDRDDILKCVAPKRKKAVARNGYEILTYEDSPVAKRHKEILEGFYNNMVCTDAVNLNQRGGVSLLMRQMMDAAGKRFAAHEIIWQPGGTRNGERGARSGLTAEFRFVPLWFFENTTGKLRFLDRDGSVNGKDLDDGGWLITVGDGVMTACAVAYIFKHLPLKDWLVYSERHGMPGIQGKTSAKKDSTEWKDMVEAVQSFAADFGCVTSQDESIDKIDMTASGQLPYPKLVERMDRALSALWRGADLSTLSAGHSEGASLQGKEADILEEDDARMISETLNAQVDKWVIYYMTGDDQPLAYIQINTSVRPNVKQELEVDKFLVESGAPLSITDTLERYGRPKPDEDEKLLEYQGDGVSEYRSGRDGSPSRPIGNETISNQEPAIVNRRDMLSGELLKTNALDELARAQADALQPVRKRLAEIMQIEDPEFQRAALRNLQGELPEILRQMNEDPETAGIIENTLAAGVINGFTKREEENQKGR